MFYDTINFLVFGLDKLCKDYNLEKQYCKAKVIERNGVKYDTMNDICLYEKHKLNPMQYIEYLNLDNEDSKTKKSIYIEYCILDCISLSLIIKIMYLCSRN